MRGLAALVVLLLAACASSPLTISECAPEGIKALCGTYRNADSVTTAFVVFPAIEHNDAAIVLLPGGPGDAYVQYAAAIARASGEQRRRHDLLIVDERGTGRSSPLLCPDALARHAREEVEGDLFPPDLVSDCRAEVERHADPRAYTYSHFIEDVEALRRTLGYDKLLLAGNSYGTRAALAYLEKHPQPLAGVALSGPVPAEILAPLHVARDSQDALDHLIDVCHMDAICHTAFPDFGTEVRTLLDRLDVQPVDVESGGYHLRFTRGTLGEWMRHDLYTYDTAATLPLMVHLAAAGDWRPIAADYMKWRKGFFDPSFPLFMTVTCASDVRRIDPATIATATAGTLFGDYRVRQHLAACERWTPGIEPLVRIARGTDVPLLVLTGDTDPVTPKRWADVVASQASKVKVVVLANNAHGDIGDCYTSLLTRFFDHPRGPLDSSCASTIPHPPFATKLP